MLLLQERLDAAEPRILARIGDLQGYQRRELLASLVGVFREKESALDAALALAADALDDYFNTVQQFDAAGFTAQAASIVIRPPFIGVDGVVASKSLLEALASGTRARRRSPGRSRVGTPNRSDPRAAKSRSDPPQDCAAAGADVD